MRNEAQTAPQLVHQVVQSCREAEARQVANALIKGYIGPDYKVTNMPCFHSAVVRALRVARMKGEDDADDILTLT
jgi:hypothetical protein